MKYSLSLRGSEATKQSLHTLRLTSPPAIIKQKIINKCRGTMSRTRYRTICAGSINQIAKNYFPKKEGLLKLVAYSVYAKGIEKKS